MQNLVAASVQMESLPRDKRANLGKIREWVEKAAGSGAELVITPECSITGYWFLRHLPRAGVWDLAEEVPAGASSQAIVAMAREFGLTIGAGLIERDGDDRLYNTYVVALADGTIHRHRKLHAFVSESLTCGSAYTVFDLPQGWRAGVLICYDCNLIENVRATALAGADVLFAPHQTGGCRTRNPHLMGVIERGLWDRRQEDPAAIEGELRGDKGRGWLMRWLPSRAHDNGLFLIFSNGVGVDDDEIRSGNAMILDPYGRILAETGKAADDMVTAELESSLLDGNTGRMWMAARRPDLYRPLTQATGRERSTRALKFGVE